MLRKWNSCEVLYNTRSVSSDMSIIHHFLTSVNEQRGRMQRSVGSTGDLPYTGFFWRPWSSQSGMGNGSVQESFYFFSLHLASHFP